MQRKDIQIYPTTQIVNGEISREKYIDGLVDNLINEFYYGRRFDPKNLYKLFKYTIQKLKKENKCLNLKK